MSENIIEILGSAFKRKWRVSTNEWLGMYCICLEEDKGTFASNSTMTLIVDGITYKVMADHIVHEHNKLIDGVNNG